MKYVEVVKIKEKDLRNFLVDKEVQPFVNGVSKSIKVKEAYTIRFTDQVIAAVLNNKKALFSKNETNLIFKEFEKIKEFNYIANFELIMRVIFAGDVKKFIYNKNFTAVLKDFQMIGKSFLTSSSDKNLNVFFLNNSTANSFVDRINGLDTKDDIFSFILQAG